MLKPLRSSPPYAAGWVIFALCLWLGAFGVVRGRAATAAVTPPPAPESSAQTPKNPAPKPAAQAATQTGTYVGEETCLRCHEAQKAGYEKSPHHRAMDPRTPAAKQSCETCHGPGSEHAEDPQHKPVKDFKKLPASDVNATCLTCHSRGEHALWDGSKHESRGLACTSCHSVHSYESKTAQLKAPTEMKLCATCHRDKVAKMERQSHMPVAEGGLTCSSCHNPHGTTNVKLLKKGESVNDLCTSCHADKRGPFLWEHPPARQGCTTCHDAHGSQNDSMLVAKLPLLCQRCHISTRHPSTLYDATQLTKPQLENRGCVNCHITIHGSTHPVGQFFLR